MTKEAAVRLPPPRDQMGQRDPTEVAFKSPLKPVATEVHKAVAVTERPVLGKADKEQIF